MLLRKRRISGWKMTMIAIAPTSRMAPRSAETMRMLSAVASTRMRKRNMMATKMFMAEEPRIQRKIT